MIVIVFAEYTGAVHQPWASLLVHGIKRLEGRSWIADDFHGCLWIHAAAHEPTPEDIVVVEQQYRDLYSLDNMGIQGGVEPESDGVASNNDTYRGNHCDTDKTAVQVAFPKSYPTSCLLGAVDVVSCLSQSDLQRLNLSPSLRMVGQFIALYISLFIE